MESYDGRVDEDRIPRFVKNGLESKALGVRDGRGGEEEGRVIEESMRYRI